MKKREFIKNISLSSAAIMLAPALLSSCGTNESKEDFKYWVWVDGNNEKTISDWTTELTALREAGITGLIIGGGREMLEKLIPIAKTLGQEVHAWLWTMNRPGDKEAQAHPEWYAVSRNGASSLEVNPYVGYYQWLCPSKPEVQEYVKNYMVSHCDIEGLSAIHLDYVRYCDVILPKGLWSKYGLVQDHEMAEYDFCYCETCQGNFESAHGYRPDSLEDPSMDEKWRKYRWDSITKLVNQVCAAVHAEGKQMSAAVFPYPELAKQLVRQSWNEWDLDIVFPMIYHNFYEEDIPWIEFATRQGVNDLNGKFPLHTGVYLPEMQPEEISQAIAAAKAGGAKGVSFFSNGALKEERLKAFSKVDK